MFNDERAWRHGPVGAQRIEHGETVLEVALMALG